MIERLRFNDEVSEEGKGDSARSVGVSWVDVEGSSVEGTSVLDLFTGLREKRCFLEPLRVEVSIRAGNGVREGALASG